MLTELVREPGPYFQERIKYPRLRTQTIIVVLAGLIANAWHIALFFILGASSAYIEDVLLLLTGIGIVEFLAWWVILTGVMHVVANLLGGDSTYGRLLRLTGYGFLPLVISGAIWSGGYYLALQGAAPPAPPRVESFQYRYESYSQFMEQVAGEPLLLGAIFFGSLFVLAAGYLWLQAVSVSADLETEQAGIAAGVAVVIYVARLFVPVI
jgi:hypothetical protein